MLRPPLAIVRAALAICFAFAAVMSLAVTTKGMAAHGMGQPCHGLHQPQPETPAHTSHHDGTSTFADDGCMMHCVGVAILAPAPGVPTTQLWRGSSDRAAPPALSRQHRLDRPPKLLV